MQEMKYALRNGDLVSIDDVEAGLKCNCICPHCKTTLVARKGKLRVHHFAHYSTADCEHGAETGLHIMAKNFISQSKTIFVPDYPKSVYEMTKTGKVFQFSSVEEEKQISSEIRGDVLLTFEGRILNVEIKVNHAVDDMKKYRLFNAGIATVEIDLGDMVNDYSEESVRAVILSGKKTTLLYSPKAKDVFSKLWLGEWKEVCRGEYVKDCPYTHQRAYFRQGDSPTECHECWGYEEYNGGPMLLCRARFGDLDFCAIDQIVEVQKRNGSLQYAELIVSGERRTFGKKM